jgi:hypothetical protein
MIAGTARSAIQPGKDCKHEDDDKNDQKVVAENKQVTPHHSVHMDRQRQPHVLDATLTRDESIAAPR